ncbi:DUF302 domain-containing protein [Aneurinibacillus sp. Ricciae_BoGa-3]|uniref:DUF302 domain-containing protein n=1 Tax=Aneurinibacillus sp. Ricciae_BoGa-3 TaxID=3022697 RepID=UPI0023410002|nr:DUF302 domain-containing protein [Aneurinibacillus sp. Ricciae_BoGa-3]WCK53896.1 DUF302 domain-containing protein [Aneurinibacillus sp. Ricciae_BoGa-3]
MDFHYTVSTTKTIEEAIMTLEQNLKQHKFGILWQLDLPAKLQEKGVQTFSAPYRILEVCNPHEAARVLNINKQAGYFLPCKITVYEEGETTYIGLPKPTAMINLLHDAQLKAIAEEIERTLIKVVEDSK